MYNFSNFNNDLEQIIDTSDSCQDVVNRGIKIMQQLISNQQLIDNDWLEQIMDGQVDNTVYRSDKNKFIVQIFPWFPGSNTPVHDHETWGLMGIYRNSLKVAEYTYDKNHNVINQTNDYVAKQGDVCYLIPPDEETHQISNITNDISVSIHVYGKNIDEYNIYDLERNEVIRQVV